MVGALADWFAVTALFRQPLGLPIPHTAIIPTRKDQLGAGLGDFVGTNFLSEQVVRDRLRSVGVAGRLGGWLTDPDHARRVTDEAATALRGAIEVLRDDDVRAVLEQAAAAATAGGTGRPAAGPAADPGGRGPGARGRAPARHRPGQPLAGRERGRRRRRGRPAGARLVAAVRRRGGGAARLPRGGPGRGRGAARPRAPAAPVGRPLPGADRPRPPGRPGDHRTGPSSSRPACWPTRRYGAASATWSRTARAMLLEAVADPDSELRRRATAGVAVVRAAPDDGRPAARQGRRLGGGRRRARRRRRTGTRSRPRSPTRSTAGTARRPRARSSSRVGRDLQFIRINGTVVGGLAGIGIHAVTQLLL